MEIGPALIGVMGIIVAAGSPLPASAQDACKNALELTARASELYAIVGQALLP